MEIAPSPEGHRAESGGHQLLFEKLESCHKNNFTVQECVLPGEERPILYLL